MGPARVKVAFFCWTLAEISDPGPFPPRCFPPRLACARPRPKTPGNIAPRADEEPEKSPILGRALVCLTAHDPRLTGSRSQQYNTPNSAIEVI